MSNEKRVFHEVMPIQNTAIHNLVAKNLIDAELFVKHVVSRTVESLPDRLLEVLSGDPITKEEWYQFLINQLPHTEFVGRKGLKYRSDLMEYRYDG